MKKIVIIGAGSWNFTRAISRDILTYPALADSHIVLVDIPAGEAYMYAAEKIIRKIIVQGGYPATVESTLDRRAALKGADAVLITIRNDTTVAAWEKDLTIPKKYGVDVVIGDTRGPSGIFRFLRSAPALAAIARDIVELCPQALVLLPVLHGIGLRQAAGAVFPLPHITLISFVRPIRQTRPKNTVPIPIMHTNALL